MIDISMRLGTRIPSWPKSPGFQLQAVHRMEQGGELNGSMVLMDIHAGTHFDAPWHFLSAGATAEAVPLELFMGPCVVVDVPDAREITAKLLSTQEIPIGTTRLLFRTQNSERGLVADPEFRSDYVALTPDAASWIVDHGILLVGIDYLSIQKFDHPPTVHHVLLEAGVVILEGLDLRAVAPGDYELVCLPLRMVGTEGAPARAILRRRDE